MDKSNKEVIVKYCDPKSILVINGSGMLRQLFVPFRVVANYIPGKTKQVFIVDEVQSTKEDKLVYVINGKLYYHSQFVIEINF